MNVGESNLGGPPRGMQLKLLSGRYAVVRLSARAAVPDWAAGELVSMTRTENELSLVVDERQVPAECRSEGGWRILEVQGPIELSQVGLLASLASTLAEAEVSLFALSTFDTDYLLVKESTVDDAIAALRAAGHDVDAVAF